MFTWGSKYFFGLSVASLLAAVVYAVISGGAVIGALTLGWKGGVGDHVGYAVLIGAALAFSVLGVVAVWVRDAQAEDMAALVGTPDQVPQALPPARPSYWGAVTAFAVACLIIGAAASTAFLILGFGLLAVVVLEWAVLAWTDRATGDAEANATLRNRLMLPIEVPLFGAAGIAVFALGVSRVLLSVSAMAAVVIASVVASVAFALAVAFAYRPGWFSRSAVTALVAGFAALVIVGGVVGAAVGPRDLEHHGEEHVEEDEGLVETGDGGAEPETGGGSSDGSGAGAAEEGS